MQQEKSGFPYFSCKTCRWVNTLSLKLGLDGYTGWKAYSPSNPFNPAAYPASVTSPHVYPSPLPTLFSPNIPYCWRSHSCCGDHKRLLLHLLVLAPGSTGVRSLLVFPMSSTSLLGFGGLGAVFSHDLAALSLEPAAFHIAPFPFADGNQSTLWCSRGPIFQVWLSFGVLA